MEAFHGPEANGVSKPLKEVWLAAAHRVTIEREALKFYPRETGGALMGYYANDDSELVITDVIDAGPNARHGLSSFAPDLAHQHSEIARIYFGSGRLHTYIGDWHTHPAGCLRLSTKDKSVLRLIASSRPARTTKPVMLIWAGDESGWDLRIWQCRLHTSVLRIRCWQYQRGKMRTH
jgi:integrative and conjugative element protein (TIGR02256 family)